MVIEIGNIIFITNPSELDENGDLTELALIHTKMEKDFKDEERLNYFKQLLLENPNTAFLIYNNINNG